MYWLDHYSSCQLQRGAVHLRNLGARAIAEFLAELSMANGGDLSVTLRLLDEYRQLTPQMVFRAGGDRFPPPAIHAVPR